MLSDGPGPYVYAAVATQPNEITIYGFSVGSTGAWTPAGSVTVATSESGEPVPVVDFLNDRVLLASDTSLDAWNIDMATGSLSPLWGPVGSPDAGDTFGSIWLAPSGNPG